MTGGKTAPGLPAYDDKGRNPDAPIPVRLAAGCIGWTIRAIYATVRYEFMQPELHARILALSGGRSIGAVWHRHVGIVPGFFRSVPWVGLASRSRDGEILARIVAILKGRCVRGSSGKAGAGSKGGGSAIRALVRETEMGRQVIFTPDGPTGPAEKVKPGVIFFASLTGLPIYPIGAACAPSPCLPTWDQTVLPVPFARWVLAYGEPMEVPRSMDDEGLEIHRTELERRILAANERAQASIQSSGDR